MKPIAVAATGMVTGVGFSAPACCTAIHCAIDNFQESRFIARGGDWITASEVPLDPPIRGREKLVVMATSAVRECLQAIEDGASNPIPLILCVSEKSRTGRCANLDESLLREIAGRLNLSVCSGSAVIANGSVGGVEAIDRAFELINAHGAPYVVVAGTDSLLAAGTLNALDEQYRLLTPSNSDGLIPGEGAAAVLLRPAHTPMPGDFIIRGLGFGTEPATIASAEPFRAEGLSAAIRDAFFRSGCSYDDVDYRVTDISGEQYAFKEAALAAAQTMNQLKEEYDIWQPADCIGDIGAAIVPTMIAVAKSAAEKEFAPGDGVLIHCANDDHHRGVIIGRSVNSDS